MNKITKCYSLMLVKEKQVKYKKMTGARSIASSVSAILKEHYKADQLPQEHFWLVCLNNNHDISAVFEVHRGTVNSCSIYARDIYQRALLCNATRIIVAHNHPSGQVMPSYQDNEVTDRLKQAGVVLGIQLLDHIILGENDSYYSYSESGQLGI